MAATIPPDVSLTLTIGPELDVEQLVVDTTDVLVTTTETPLLLSLGVVQGEAGYVGPPGPPGPAATCDAGSTVTLPPGSFAKVINVGSKDAAIFDFEIPQGVAGPVGPAGPMLWVPYTGSGQSFAYQNLTRDGDWTMCANKNTSDRPAPQASGTEEDLLPPWTPASLNARATYTVYNEWTLNQSGWLDQYGIDILAQNLGALHQVTLTVNGVVKDHVSFTPNGPEVFWINITPLLVVSGAVVRVTLQVTIVANNLMYWLQQTGLFATAPSYCSLAVGSKDGAAAGTTAYGCHAIFIPGAASPDWDIVAYGGTASPGSGTAPPLADTTQDGLLRKVSGLTTDFVDGSNNCQNLGPAVIAAAPKYNYYSGTVGGTVNAITLTHSPACPALLPGQIFSFYASGRNSGTVTLSVDGLAAKNVAYVNTGGLVGGELAANNLVSVVYDGTRFLILTSYAPRRFLWNSVAQFSGSLSAPAINTVVAVPLALGTVTRGIAADFTVSGNNIQGTRDGMITAVLVPDRALTFSRLEMNNGLLQAYADAGAGGASTGSTIYSTITMPTLAALNTSLQINVGTACNLTVNGSMYLI